MFSDYFLYFYTKLQLVANLVVQKYAHIFNIASYLHDRRTGRRCLVYVNSLPNIDPQFVYPNLVVCNDLLIYI